MRGPRKGWIEKRGNRWRMQIRVNGERIRKTFRTKKEAQEALDEILETIESAEQTGVAKKIGTITVADLVRGYLERRHPHLEPSTRARYANVIEKHVIPGIGGIDVRDIAATPQMLEDFLQDEVPWGSARKALEVLGPAFRMAFDNGVVPSNPVTKIRKPKRPVKQKKKEIPTPPEVEKIVAAAWEEDEAWGTFVEVVATLGTRRSETCALRVQDLEFPPPGATRGLVHIGRTVAKGDEGTYIKLPKGGFERSIQADMAFFEMIEPLVRKRGSGWLFPGRTVSPRRDPSDLTHSSSAGRLTLWLLARGGEVTCPSGRAGAEARRAIGVNSSTLSQVTSALVHSGSLIKECNARRTFRLALTEDGLRAADALHATPPVEGLPMHPDTASHRFAEMMRRTGLRTPTGRLYGLHSLRHFVATHLYNRTHDWVQVQHYLGHASPIITVELYANNVIDTAQAKLADEAVRLFRTEERSDEEP